MWSSLTYLFTFSFLFSGLASAHQGVKHVNYQQPGDNGKLLHLNVVGDRHYSRTETTEGYTVVFNIADKTYYYAVLNTDGSALIASKVKAGDKAPENLQKKLKLTAKARSKKALERVDNEYEEERNARWEKKVQKSKEKRKQKLKQMRERKQKKLKNEDIKVPQADAAAETTTNLLSTELNPAELNASGVPETQVGLTILVQFPDDPNTVEVDPVNFPATQEKIERYCNELGYNDDGNTGSVRDYFNDQSNGLLDYTMSVTHIITMPQPRDYYNYSDYPTNNTLHPSGTSGRLLMADSAAILNSENFDFSGLSVDSNNNVLATNIFFAGGTSGVWPLGLWPHQWSTAYSSRPEIIINGVTSYLYSYQITNLSSSSASIGTFIHENGHLILDYPDLYDYGGDSSGIGTHGIMASGNHRNNGKSPTPINLYFKDILGWANITDIESFDYIEASLPATGNVGYRITNPNDTDEFFMIENRGYANGATGGDKWAEYAPDEGIMIWHIDDGVSGNNDQQMTAALHYQVSLEQQDGEFDLEGNRGADSQDAYDNNSATFNDNSLPDANWWSGDPSGISINVGSSAGATMDVIFGLNVDLAVASPNGGETVFQNSTAAIQWYGNATGNVRIDLLKGGSLLETLSANETNDGSFTWAVTTSYPKADDYRIRVSLVSDGSIVDESNGDFSVSGELFVAGGVYPNGWVQSASSDGGWSVNSDEASEGEYSLASDIITHNQNSQVEYTTDTIAGVITFDAKVSSEANYDYLRFYIDGVEQFEVAGDSGWVSHSYPVTAGTHTFRWSYEKDFSVSSNDDRAYLDNVTIPEALLTGIDQWRDHHFNDGDDATVTGDLADPDSDGISNLLEYAMGTDPNDTMSFDTLDVTKEGTSLSIVYPKNMLATDLSFEYQHHADLSNVNWLPATVTEQSMGTAENIETMQATMTIPESEKHHFMRLKVTLVE